jgi:hypothetical protein
MMDVNKATAQELGTPALARLSLRQEYVRYMIVQIITLALDQAEIHGVISKRANKAGQLRPGAWPLEVTLPDLKQANQIAVAQAINNIVVGLGLAYEQGMVDIEIARDVVVMFIEQMGIHIDKEAMITRIKANPPPPPVSGAGPGSSGPGTGNSPISLNRSQNLPSSAAAQQAKKAR